MRIKANICGQSFGQRFVIQSCCFHYGVNRMLLAFLSRTLHVCSLLAFTRLLKCSSSGTIQRTFFFGLTRQGSIQHVTDRVLDSHCWSKKNYNSTDVNSTRAHLFPLQFFNDLELVQGVFCDVSIIFMLLVQFVVGQIRR